MSETEHHSGIATKIEIPIGKTLMQVAEEILLSSGMASIPDYYDDALECLRGDYSEDYFYYEKTKTLYKITDKETDAYDEIILAEVKDNNTIEYVLRYYNGGAGFEECLEEAFDKIDTNETK